MAMRKRLLWVWWMMFGVVGWGGAAPVRTAHVEAELVSAQLWAQPGHPLTVGLRLKHDPHWHTYWKSSYTGYATSLTWELPEGFIAGEIRWPAPKPYEFQGIADYVYDGEVVLPVTLTVPADLPPGEEVTLRAKAEWLMCEKTCVPGEAELSLTLPVRAGEPPANEPWRALFAEAERLQPRALPSVSATATRMGDEVTLRVKGVTVPPDAYFFDSSRLILPQIEQFGDRADEAATFKLRIDPAAEPTNELRGLLRTSGTFVPGEDVPAITIVAPLVAGEQAGVAGAGGWGAVLRLAFIGGLLLNLMPCVFPVLGLKVMSFVQQGGEDRRRVVAHGLAFAGGLLLSLWALVGLLLALRAAGEEAGWGFQLQSPTFLFLLCLLLLLLGLNMVGVFEIGQTATGVGQGLAAKPGMAGSFFSGVLATVVATPCSAPFLGTALGAALTLPASGALAVFTAFGLGLAAPYLVLSAFPRLVRVLPRPGPWMETFRQAMGFLLFASVAVFFWVLAVRLLHDATFSDQALLKSGLALVMVAVAAWVFGRWGAFHRSAPTRRVATGLAVLLGLGAAFAGLPRPGAVSWQAWEPGLPEALAKEGKIVYVDFTASWCLTCQANKGLVFSSDEVIDAFRDRGIVAVKADWTARDPEITRELARFQHSAVPFNLIYAPGRSEPIPLPELLTPGIVLEALEGVP